MALELSTRAGQAITLGRFGFDLLSYPSVRDSYSRRLTWDAGYLDAFFTITGEEQILSIFNQGLGYRVKETEGTETRFEGFVYEMILRGQVDRVKSYEKVYNSVSAGAKNLLTNGTFETGDFTGWTEVVGNGSVAIESNLVDVGRGLHSARVNSGTGGSSDTWIEQTVAADSQTPYRLTFYYSDDDSGVPVRYRVESDIGVIIPTTVVTVTGGRFRRETVDFVTQVSATEITVFMAAPDTNSVSSLFDDVRVERVVNERPARALSPLIENDESIAVYGRKQRFLRTNYQEMIQAVLATVDVLQNNAFPKVERGDLSFVEPSLDVFVRGYIETTNWNFWALQTGGAHVTVQAALEQIRDNNEFIDSVIVNGSPPDVALPDTYIETQAFILRSLSAQIGSGFRIFMGANRTLTVEETDYSPRYFMRGGLIYKTAATADEGLQAINERDIQPAIVRDMDSLIEGVEPSSAFDDRRDFLMRSVEVDASGVSFGVT